MRILISILLAALVVSSASTGARAQNNLLVVSSCGTLPRAYLPGAVRTGTQDVNGRACGAASIVGAGDATAANQALQITQETAFNTALGLIADAACATDNGTCSLIALVKRGNQRLTTIIAGIPVTGPLTDTQLRATAVPVSGTVAVTGVATAANQTTEITALGTINTTLGSPFQVGDALGAGSAIIGNVRIDQTTPGTTNGVQVNAALPAGTNLIGTIDGTGKTTTQVSAAPTATTFASLLASSASRKGCAVQNTGATLGYIFFGATGSATTANSFQLAAGQSISCTAGNTVLTDNVAGTCASSTCAFIISSQ